MATLLFAFSPHWINTGSGSTTMGIDEAADMPVPILPDHATEGTKPGTAVAGSLRVGDQACVAGFSLEISSITEEV